MPGWLTPQSHEDDTQPRRVAARLPRARGRDVPRAAGVRPRQRHDPARPRRLRAAPESARSRSRSRRSSSSVSSTASTGASAPFTGDAADRRDCPDGGDRIPRRRIPSSSTRPRSRITRTRSMPHRGAATPTRTTRRSPTSAASPGRSIARSGATARTGATRCGSPSTATRRDPPDPYLGWPWKTQARFLAQAEWLAYRRPRVRSTAQFLLYDDAPRRDLPGGATRALGHVPDRPAKTAERDEDGLRRLPARRLRVPRRPAGPAWARVRLLAHRDRTHACADRVQAEGEEALADREAREDERAGYLLTKVVKVEGSGALRIVFGDTTTRAARVRG